jgi:predicted metal-dependent hydrolase
MFTQQKDNNTATTRNNQTAQKSQKEKTMSTGHTNSLADIDVTKPLTPEEQALVVESTKEEPTNATAKLKESNANTEEKKKGYISSFVGDCISDPEKGTVVNLGKDVLFVQQNLNRLGILSDKDFANEKSTSEKEVSKSKIPATIEAIGYFQERVLLTPKADVDNQVWPGYNTINTLANITQTKFRAQLFEFTKKQVREKIEATLKEMSAAREAEIERIKNEPATDENVGKLYSQADNINQLGRLLKDYAVYNPEFVLKAYSLVGYSDTDNLTRAIMFYLNDTEIAQLTPELDAKFYDSMDEGVTTDTEHALMKKLKKGRGVNIEAHNMDSADKKDSKKKNLDLVEKGEELLKNKYYNKHYAYLPFTGPKTGTKYKKGDYIDEKDRVATYGSKNKPTWCNLFARDLMKKVLNKDIFDGIKSAKEIYGFMLSRPAEFVPVNTGFEDVWNNEINKNEIVFLIDNGHIAVGVPTELKQEHKRTFYNAQNKLVTEKIGFVIQAGSSNGHMILSQAWAKKDFKNIKMFKYVSKE